MDILLLISLTCFGIGLFFLALWLISVVIFRRRSVNEQIVDKMVLQLLVPANNDKTPLAAEQLFQSLHGILRKHKRALDHFSLEIVGSPKGIYFLVVCNRRYKEFIENQIYAQYPQAQIKVIKDYVDFAQHDLHYSSIELSLEQASYLPIKTFVSFEVDPLASITGAISKIPNNYEVWIQYLVRPNNNDWQNFGKQYVKRTKDQKDSEGKAIPLESGQSEVLGSIERKNAKVGFQFILRIVVKGPDEQQCQRLLEDIEAAFKQYQTANLNSIGLKKSAKGLLALIKRLLLGKSKTEKVKLLDRYKLRLLDQTENCLVNVEELASLYHLPSASVETPNIAWVRSRKLDPPDNLPLNNARFFGITDFRNIHKKFGILKEDRSRHMYLLGKTGSGKSTLLKNMIVADIFENKGLAVVDPHGDLVEEILDLIPEHRIDDVIYLDPSDTEFPVGLNMLDIKPGETVELLSDGIVSVFKKFFGTSWGPRMQYILTNVLLTLLYCQNVSLLAVQRILIDKNYRTFLLKQVKDPFLLQFWEKEFEEMSKNPRLITEAIAPIQNKVGRFLNSPMVRNMIGQVKSSIDLQALMNKGKILLVNLSQGKIGEENSALLGGMIVTRLYTSAMQRAFLAKEERQDFYLYVDEFQNFATETFIKILSEARKYGLNLIVTHQYIDQISEEIQRSIFGNVGSLMNFVVGRRDAEKLAEEYAPLLSADDLVNLDKYRMIVKMMISGSQSKPFTAISLPPEFKEYRLRAQVLDSSRSKYATPKAEIETKLKKWSEQNYDNKGRLITADKSSKTNHKNSNKKEQQETEA